jgi:uncharacterized membrane protein YbaN (DUF454 family)
VSSLKRTALLLSGYVLVAFGAVGIVLPIIPTTPFLIAAAICFASSSPRAKEWLEHNRFFGEYIENYRTGAGVSGAKKVRMVIFLWIMLAVSGYFMQERMLVLLILLAVGLAVTAHILLLKTRHGSDQTA